MTIQLNKPLETHEHIVGNSREIFSMVVPKFYGVIVMIYGDVVNSIFCITLIVFVKYLPRDFCDGLDFITNCIN